MDDVRAVLDATGSSRAALIGVSEGGPMSLLYAATYPERTSALVLYGSYARRAWAPDHPFGVTSERMQGILETLEKDWGASGLQWKFGAQACWATKRTNSGGRRI
jgi:pimeloyl-ACP methyl ester carboxylesterase